MIAQQIRYGNDNGFKFEPEIILSVVELVTCIIIWYYHNINNNAANSKLVLML